MTKINTNPDDWKKGEIPNSENQTKQKSIGDSLNPFSDLQLLFSFFRDWSNKKYTGISFITLALSAIAVLYLVSPIDLIPDFSLPIIGFVDDAAVLALVSNRWKKEFQKYKLWKQKN